MRNKGFTLIELLAVITVIAIIATITVIVTNKIIKNTKNTLLERQKLTIEEAARDYYLKEGMNANFDSKESCVNLSKLLSKGYLETKEVVNPKTKETMDGSVIITYSANQYNYKYQDTICHYSNGQVVYFDVTKGETCNNYTEENSNTGYNGIGGTGKQNGCMKFYIFNYDGGDTVSLLLDHNTAFVAWTSSISATSGPNKVLAQLKTDTDAWQGTETPSNYIMDQTGQTSKAKYTIDYSDYRARLITANEIATITGNTTWDEVTATGYYYVHDNTQTLYEGAAGTNKYAWLFDNTKDCTTYGCNVADSSTNGYWSASSTATDTVGAWYVGYNGRVSSGYVVVSDLFGVRPVIEILKSKLE